MNCDTALDLMLEADLTELRGEGESELAQHIHTCADCRAKAGVILAGQNALAEVLDRISPRTAAPQAIRVAKERARRRPWRVTVPLALAAGVGALLLVRQPVPLPSNPPSAVAREIPFDVRVPAGRSVAVFRTDNPNIVVIWSF